MPLSAELKVFQLSNIHLDQQCNMMLSSIRIFRHGARAACLKDDGKIDRQEQRELDEIEKKLKALEGTLRDIIGEGVSK